jgi:uncharacterized protein (TIGR03435 family)
LQPSATDPNEPPADPQGGVNISGTGSGNGISVTLGRGSYYTFANGRFEAKKVSVETAASILERFLDRPVVNLTKLSGTYDFSIDVTTEDYNAMLIRAGINAGVVMPPQALRLLDGAGLGSLFDGLDKLGLKLIARKAPLDLLVIESALKTPTEN